ncbi:TonB family protein [Paraburkholderia fungorum]|uniref:TonB family protein n=1 Tax=Paraburkholderia fungorum TaxID=134537 RepID=UPI002091E80A|nr:TonB family protein [Paraburkholderia fungorum]USU19184.1 TonB family protein [Paraburkholderia fungorum]USU28820.1 TonB family protein [Paraburkholderia fungorum]
MATVPVSGMPQERTRLFPAAALALVAEALLLGGALVFLTHKAPAPVELPPTTLTLAAPPAPTPPAPPAPKPVVPTPPKLQTPPVRPVVPVHHLVTHTPPPKPAVAPPLQPVQAPAPVTPSVAPTEPAPAPPPVPAPSAAPTTASPSFEGALRAAIQAALRYPESARMAGMSGRTRVAFQYRDGVVSDVRVIVPSGLGLLDRAAVAAVRDAAYPKPDPDFVGKTLSEQLWVTFDLDRPD